MAPVRASMRVEDDDAAITPSVRGIARPARRTPRRIVAGVLLAIATTCTVAVVIAGVLILWPRKQKTVERTVGVAPEVPYRLVGVEAFDAACGATLYRNVCLQTLLPKSRAHSATPEGLTGILIASAAQGVARTLASVLANRGVNRLGFSGERVCHSTLVSSMEQLDSALAALKSQPLDSYEETQSRLRAAAEFHATCIDALVATGALEPLTVDAKQHAEKLLRNAIAVVAALSRFGPNLLSWEPTHGATDWGDPGNGLPSWVKEEIFTGVDPPIDVLVAKDGSGKFKSIQGAVDAAPRNAERYVIGIKAGVYNEQVVVPKSARNLMFLGDGAGLSIITGNRSVATTPDMTTFFSPTLIVEGEGFIGKGFTARNTAAALKGRQQLQAVAMRASADMAAFDQCVFEGGQDALHTHTFRQFYRGCTIVGTVANRFILGNNGAVASFQSCSTVVKI